jgi:hypothetical protein
VKFFQRKQTRSELFLFIKRLFGFSFLSHFRNFGIWTNFETKSINIGSLFQLKSIQQQIGRLQANLKESNAQTAIQLGSQIADNPWVQTNHGCVWLTTFNHFKETEAPVGVALKAEFDPRQDQVDSRDENPAMAFVEGGMGQENNVPRPILRESAFTPSIPYCHWQINKKCSDCSWLAADETTRGLAANEESRRMATNEERHQMAANEESHRMAANEERHHMAAIQARRGRSHIPLPHGGRSGPQRQQSELNPFLVHSGIYPLFAVLQAVIGLNISRNEFSWHEPEPFFCNKKLSISVEIKIQPTTYISFFSFSFLTF